MSCAPAEVLARSEGYQLSLSVAEHNSRFVAFGGLQIITSTFRSGTPRTRGQIKLYNLCTEVFKEATAHESRVRSRVPHRTRIVQATAFRRRRPGGSVNNATAISYEIVSLQLAWQTRNPGRCHSQCVPHGSCAVPDMLWAVSHGPATACRALRASPEDTERLAAAADAGSRPERSLSVSLPHRCMGCTMGNGTEYGSSIT